MQEGENLKLYFLYTFLLAFLKSISAQFPIHSFFRKYEYMINKIHCHMKNCSKSMEVNEIFLEFVFVTLFKQNRDGKRYYLNYIQREKL